MRILGLKFIFRTKDGYPLNQQRVLQIKYSIDFTNQDGTPDAAETTAPLAPKPQQDLEKDSSSSKKMISHLHLIMFGSALKHLLVKMGNGSCFRL